MKNSMNNMLIIAIVLLAFGSGYLLAPEKVEYRAETTIDTVTQVVVDYIKQDPIVVEKKIFLKDTVFITKTDTIITEVASIDTTMPDMAEISVDYYLEPKVFDISYTPGPVKTIENTIYRTTVSYVDTSEWWNKAWVGVAGSAILVFLLK